jgi:hypothetical protein
MAEGYAAVHAAGSLEPPLVLGELDFHLAVIVYSLFYRPVTGDFSSYR